MWTCSPALPPAMLYKASGRYLPITSFVRSFRHRRFRRFRSVRYGPLYLDVASGGAPCQRDPEEPIQSVTRNRDARMMPLYRFRSADVSVNSSAGSAIQVQEGTGVGVSGLQWRY